MKRFVNGLALMVAVTCLVWVAVLWRWQSTRRDMSVEDIALYMGLLPVFAIVLILMARWAWRGQVAQRAALAAGAQAHAANTATGDSAAQQPSTSDAAQRHAVHAVWLAAVNCPAGASADELLAAAQANEPRPDLDKDLTDPDGQPLMCARVPDLPTDALAAELAPVIAQVRQRLSAADHASLYDEPDDAVVRALTALQTPLDEARQALQPWSTLFQASDSQAAHELGEVHVLIGLPAAWTPLEQQVTEDWIRLSLTDPERSAVPASRFAWLRHHDGSEALWLQADQLLMQCRREQRRALVLLLGLHSDISEVAVQRLAARQALFQAGANPKGNMPGEAACALLLASADWPGLPPDADDPELAPLAWVHRPALARRDKSVDAGGKVLSTTLSQVIEQAQAASRLPTADIASLVCDGDQHTARSTELFGATLALLPDLDAVDDMRLTATVCAGPGAATPLAVIAAACAHTRALNKPVMALCLGDPFARLALVARPDQPEEDAARAAGATTPAQA